jgi:hypothetical protein
VEFYVQYEGRLPSQNSKDKENRRVETHRIRRHFHSQLLRLWNDRFSALTNLPPRGTPGINEHRRRFLEDKSASVRDTEFLVFPIVTKAEHLVCALDITLYRHDKPGSFVGPSGDLDNRLKVLFDAMTIPNASQLDGLAPEQGERPLFCLLEDDALIVDLRIKAVQLWTTVDSNEEKRDFKVAVNVKVSSTEFAGYGVAALPDM